MTRQELHAALKNQLANNEPIAADDIRAVSLIERLETVKEKTRELCDLVYCADSQPAALHAMFDTFDLLANDWLQGPEAKWEGSLAWKHGEKIKAFAQKMLPGSHDLSEVA